MAERLGCSTFPYRAFPAEVAAERIAALGFRAIEPVSILGQGHIDPLDPKASAPLWLELADRHNLAIAGLNVTWGGAAQRDDDRLEKESRLTWGAILLAKELGAPVITVQAGQKFPSEQRPVMLETAARALARLTEEAASAGVGLAFEIHKNLLIERVEDALAFLDRVADQRLGVTLDTSLTGAVGESPAEAVLRLGGRVRHIHLRDYRGDSFMVVPGEGECDFGAVKRALDAVGYAGQFVLEPPGRGDSLESIDRAVAAAKRAVERLF